MKSAAMERKQRSSLVFTSLAHFTNDGNFFLFPLLMRYYATVNIDFGILAVGAVVYEVISGLLSPFVGQLSDRTGMHAKLLSLGLFLSGISIVLFSIPFFYSALSSLSILLGTVFFGIGISFYHPLGGSILSFAFKKGRYGSALGMNGSMGSLGRTVIPLVLGLIVPVSGPSYGLIYVAIYEFITSFLVFAGLRWFSGTQTNPPKKDYTDDSKTVITRKYSKITRALTSVIFLRSVFTGGVVIFIPYYIGYIFDLNPYSSLPNFIVSAAFLAPIFGQPIFGMLTERKGGKFTVSISSLLAVAFMALFLLTHLVYLMIIFLGTFAFAVFSGFPVLMGYISQVVPGEILASSNGKVWGIGGTLGSAVGIVIFYLIYDFLHLSPGISMWFLVLVGFVSLLLLPILPSEKKMPGKGLTSPHPQ